MECVCRGWQRRCRYVEKRRYRKRREKEEERERKNTVMKTLMNERIVREPYVFCICNLCIRQAKYILRPENKDYVLSHKKEIKKGTLFIYIYIFSHIYIYICADALIHYCAILGLRISLPIKFSSFHSRHISDMLAIISKYIPSCFKNKFYIFS